MPGIDGIYVGPFDLSTALGKPAQFDDPEIKDAIRHIQGVCRDAAVYTDSMDAEFAAPLAEALRGCRFRVADLCGRVREVPACCQIADDLCALLGEQEI